MTRKR